MALKNLAIIVEQECVGCVRCIQVCPVDAILGTAKHTHTVIAAECIGCELCVAPCPVDCIVIKPITEKINKKQRNARTKYRRNAQILRKKLAIAARTERERKSKELLAKKKQLQ